MPKHYTWQHSRETDRTDNCDVCGKRAQGTTHYLCEAPIWHVCNGCGTKPATTNPHPRR